MNFSTNLQTSGFPSRYIELIFDGLTLASVAGSETSDSSSGGKDISCGYVNSSLPFPFVKSQRYFGPNQAIAYGDYVRCIAERYFFGQDPTYEFLEAGHS